jgi:hypothetical protein
MHCRESFTNTDSIALACWRAAIKGCKQESVMPVNRIFPALKRRFSFQDACMGTVSLSDLHARKLEVRLSINDLIRRFRGIGSYEADDKLGNVLRIDVDDGNGGFSLLLQEGQAKCVISAARESDLDYHVHL